MTAMVWWAIPLAATFGAILYVAWRGRPGPPQNTHDAIEARDRFRKAMESGTPPRSRGARGANPPAQADKASKRGGSRRSGDAA